MEVAVRVENVSFQYANEQTYALQNVSFQVYEGEWVTIVGHNGSGKSTLAKLLIGLLPSTSGTIHVCGIPLNEETVWDVRKRLGIVFQNPDNQFVGTTVQDDVAFGLENRGVPKHEMEKRIKEALQKVGMENFMNDEPHRLSGGQKQRVAIASAIALQPNIIILDEATSMLDPSGKKEVLQVIQSLRREHDMTVISITHDLNEVAKADRVIVMNKGRIALEGTPKHIFAHGMKLEEMGLDLPFSLQLSQRLKDNRIPITTDHLTIEGLVSELWTLYSAMSNTVTK
ncbi:MULTISPECIES: energy-coupling factor ABC transporter ATP-binding protein [Anoxybacillus]|uniref:ATPase component of ral energizing module of ECF transporter n=1 Tax=Anoxybacillus flavithermus TaxID=33934 RepID=A0A178TKF6_9BACL|nr:energy-coupling factor ABC transporter ATP-binding protein [Anoxybacillus flavithermus]ASA97327.1 energy-coupling factor transporter ATPase [Anoxybacillus flavithermus]MBE2907681.1 energy-coupling factor ABC transporter ATP-binding protein [Anoxybacillus flavithermus]MBE2910342.1 energy-coupling factor ABC transporter ATP-binding protein [Anoxybacillus flavithermus]MBE2913224.1 energy-coupling factor ABC transporter ATP-binding protein [Anoxybacillus flavithermus]MBE2915818.1 energy-couplin